MKAFLLMSTFLSTVLTAPQSGKYGGPFTSHSSPSPFTPQSPAKPDNCWIEYATVWETTYVESEEEECETEDVNQCQTKYETKCRAIEKEDCGKNCQQGLEEECSEEPYRECEVVPEKRCRVEHKMKPKRVGRKIPKKVCDVEEKAIKEDTDNRRQQLKKKTGNQKKVTKSLYRISKCLDTIKNKPDAFKKVLECLKMIYRKSKKPRVKHQNAI